jgi:hypothetical protein
VSASVIASHLPDPMNFLAFLGKMAKEAIFFFDQVIDTDALLVAYSKPREGFDELGSFPYRFNSETRLSRGLLYHAFEELGFPNIVEIPHDYEWLTGVLWHSQVPEGMHKEWRPYWKLGAELLPGGSRHSAVLAMR